eukprot:Gb_23032 [translate_table: standard]
METKKDGTPASPIKAATPNMKFLDLDDDILRQILIRLPLCTLFPASTTCSTLKRIISSPDFLKDYDKRNNEGWIVTDNNSSDSDPALFFYQISSNRWRSIPFNAICPDDPPLYPRLLSASGGLMLFLGHTKDRNGMSLRRQVLLVVNPLTRHSRRLPDPPVLLEPDQESPNCIEMVTDSPISNYKVIILNLHQNNGVFVYKSCDQAWSSVHIPNIFPVPGGISYRPSFRVCSRSAVHNGILYWLIIIDLIFSYLVFYDIQRDALHRETIRVEGTRCLCGVAVPKSGDIVRVSKDDPLSAQSPQLKLFKLDVESGTWDIVRNRFAPNLRWDKSSWAICTGHTMVACSNEEEDAIWVVSLVNNTKVVYGKRMIGRHMEIMSYNFRSRRWTQPTPCCLHEPDEKALKKLRPTVLGYVIYPRTLSQAKWIALKFTANV